VAERVSTQAVEVNPYANFNAGIIGVRVMHSIDVIVRHRRLLARNWDHP
jgi:hypothetical protein